MSDNLPAPTFSWLLASFTVITICRFVDVVALHSMTVAVSKWGSPGPTSRCRGVSLWCTGPTRAPLNPTHYQFLQLLFLLFIIKCFATRSSRGVSILSSLFCSCRARLTPRGPILCSRLFITLCRASLAQPNILFDCQ